MHYTAEMLRTHPTRSPLDPSALVACVTACFGCAQACTSCADACIAMAAARLVRCIRLNLDCADVCDVTGRMLSRQAEPDWGLFRAQLEACRAACRACGAECERHSHHMEHCRVCAEACRECERACDALLRGLPV